MVISACGLLVAALLGSLTSAKPLTTQNVELRMPGVQPQVADTYLCVAKKVTKTTYITGFVPHANMKTAHHMLLYGCTDPGNEKDVWNCGEMLAANSEFPQKPVCKSGAKIIYAWAMDAPALQLPKDVAFKVAGDTDVKWLVLQVHYKDVTNFLPPKNGKDISGITLKTTSTPLPKRAGVYLMGTGGSIPPHSTTYMETACLYNEPLEVHPFAFRTHAHVHGKVNSGYRVRDGKWTEIGRKSPGLPEMFYNVTNPGMVVKKGDILAARCTMVNNEDREVAIGSTQNDEMCNFYMMYWVKGDHIMKENYCFTEGPPSWSWDLFKGINTSGIPDTASVVPGTSELLKATEEMVAKETGSINNELEALEDFISSLQREPYVEYDQDEGVDYDGDNEVVERRLREQQPQQARYWDEYRYEDVY